MAVNLALKVGPTDLGGIYDQDDEQQRLGEIMDAAYGRVIRAVHQVVAESFPNAENFRLDDSATRRLLHEAASRVVRIDETTRQAIATMLQRGQEMGLSAWEIANGTDEFPGIEGLFRETWRGRAETVARTELQHAQNRAAVDRYQATGLVDRVELVDGDEDQVCAARNGKVVPLEQVPGLAHPRCTLLCIPILREDVA